MDRDIAKASVRGILWNVVQNIAGRLSSVVVIVILSRLLDRTAFGVVALAAAITAVLDLLVGQGVAEFVVQRERLSDEEIDTAFWSNVGLATGLAGALVLAAEPLAEHYHEAALAPVTRWMAAAVVIRSLSIVPAGLLARDFAFRALSTRSMLASVLGGGVGVIAALRGWGAMALVAQTLAADAIGAATLWGTTPWRPTLRFQKVALGAVVRFGAPTVGASLLASVSRRLDSLIIAEVLGTAALGAYAIAQRVFQIGGQILHKSADAVALAAFARLAGSPEERRDAFYVAGETAVGVCFPAYVGLALVARPFVEAVLGAQWGDSAPILSVLCAAGLVLTTSYLHASALKAAGRTRDVLVVHVVLSVAYIALLTALLRHGVIGAAIAYTASVALVWPLEVWFVRAAIGVDVGRYFVRIVRPAIASIAMGAILLAINSALGSTSVTATGALTIQVAVGGVSYAVLLRLLAPAVFQRLAAASVQRLARRFRRADKGAAVGPT